MKRIFCILGCLAIAAATARADQTIQLIWSYNFPGTYFQIYGPDGVTPLDGAGTGPGGSGFVLQLGYYSAATVGDPFAGMWVPVFGPGTSNSLFSTAGMGDGTAATGTNINFSFDGTIDSGVPSTETGIPAAGQIMSIRYYNSYSLSGTDAATYYGAVSDDSWTWVSPADPAPPGMSFSLLDPDVVYQGGVLQPETNLLYTAVPEPSAGILIVCATAMGGMARKRLKMRAAR